MKYQLKLGWLYPELMNTYGDRGNVIVLKKRAEWRKIELEVNVLSLQSDSEDIRSCDLFLMGGAQDRQQEIVNRDLVGVKSEALLEKLNSNTPGIFVCGAYQFLGKYYKAADGTNIQGLGFFDMYTEHPGEGARRLIGNIQVQAMLDSVIQSEANYRGSDRNLIVGFENHGGRTYLGNKADAFATVVKGYGNNGEDKAEGMFVRNTLGTYLHGPLLPKNPQLADFFIQKAIEVKYNDSIKLQELDTSFEEIARNIIVKKK